MLKRIIALSVIFTCSWIAWAILSLVVTLRTQELGDANRGGVAQLWGSEHSQVAPTVLAGWKERVKRPFTEEEKNAYLARSQGAEIALAASQKRAARQIVPLEEELYAEELVEKSAPLELSSSNVEADLAVDYRQKGLLWFSTYTVKFRAAYEVANPYDYAVGVRVSVPFPSASAVYDDMELAFEDEAKGGASRLETSTENGQMSGTFELPARGVVRFVLRYGSRGLDSWSYRFGDNVRRVENLKVVLRTDFDAIDFPQGSISPDRKTRRSGGGWELSWDKESLVSGQQIGMLMPHKLNPGPLAASMSLHAPVSLFFFFFVMFMIQALRDIRMHPMNYFFLAASFFSFNLLFSYLVDHVALVPAFAVAAAVSLLLVVSYVRIVVGAKFAVLAAGTCQLVYQVMFGVAHFFEGYTGLTITIGAIVTLAVVMHITARLDWEHLFKRQKPSSASVSAEAR